MEKNNKVLQKNLFRCFSKKYSYERFAFHRLESAKYQLEKLKKNVPNLYKKGKCLDAGCGLGGFLVLANLSGLNFYGYDLDKQALEIAKELLRANKISLSKINNNPQFEKNKFDLIISFEVVEHIKNVDHFIKDLSQVISKKGVLFIETPNYLIPYEPHFYVFLPPIPRFGRWIICKLAGRTNRNFFNELNFVTTFSLQNILSRNGFTIQKIGEKIWLSDILGKPTHLRSRYVRLISKVIQLLNLGWLIKIVTRCGFYTPQVYLCFPK